MNKRHPSVGNLFSGLPGDKVEGEIFDTLQSAPGMRIERIVSTGQVTAEDDWYDQDDDEWVVVLAGAARLQIEGESEERSLTVGDWIRLPAHCRHRVTWTQDNPPTVWLAVHHEPDDQ
ncbi:cupin domain-containing protein [Nitratireductor sp. XY-223]|uniref:cupin domain-containing protein n=1 Tax=Nitratireductor sp. XY-223 TaxID=2561926 RepID=UPI0010AA8C7E|nr:cupin domain-containing protein [Nitratireductor sp. XY-223]